MVLPKRGIRGRCRGLGNFVNDVGLRTRFQRHRPRNLQCKGKLELDKQFGSTMAKSGKHKSGTDRKTDMCGHMPLYGQLSAVCATPKVRSTRNIQNPTHNVYH